MGCFSVSRNYLQYTQLSHVWVSDMNLGNNYFGKGLLGGLDYIVYKVHFTGDWWFMLDSWGRDFCYPITEDLA